MQQTPLSVSENPDAPLVSVTVLNFNGKQHLKTCLDSLLTTDYPNFELILVDNASTDGSIQWVEQNYPNVKIVKNPINKGTSGGYNAGIKCSNGKYVAILNNDIEVDPNWLRHLVNAAEQDKNVAAVDSKYLSFYKRNCFDTVSAGGRFIDRLGNVYARGSGQEDCGLYDEQCRAFMALAMFRRSVFFEVGLFDEDFFCCYEDVDLSWRINLGGYHIYYEPRSVIYHKSSSSISPKRNSPKFYLFDKRNKLVSLIKNYSVKSLVFVLPISLFEYCGLFFFWVLKGEKTYAFCVVKAVFEVLKSTGTVWKKHVLNNCIRRASDKSIRNLISPYAGYLKNFLSK